MGFCKQEYEPDEVESLSFVEKNVCINRKAIIAGIGLVFIFSVISGMIFKKMKNKSQNNKSVAVAAAIKKNN